MTSEPPDVVVRCLMNTGRQRKDSTRSDLPVHVPIVCYFTSLVIICTRGLVCFFENRLHGASVRTLNGRNVVRRGVAVKECAVRDYDGDMHLHIGYFAASIKLNAKRELLA